MLKVLVGLTIRAYLSVFSPVIMLIEVIYLIKSLTTQEHHFIAGGIYEIILMTIAMRKGAFWYEDAQSDKGLCIYIYKFGEGA